MADELSPAYLRSGVEFSVKLRGYDLEQVDEFLDRMADGIEALQQQVRQTTERAVRAEQLAAEHAAVDQALRRTLVLAQQTADEVIKDAEAEAERRRAEAEETARSIIVAAEAQAARQASEAQRRLRDDLAALQQAREALQSDVDALGRHLAGERERLRRLADAELSAAPAPEPTDVAVPPAPVVPELPTAAMSAVEIGEALAIEAPADVDASTETEIEAEAETATEIELRDDADVRDVDVDVDALDVEVPDDASSLDVPHDEFLAELRKATDDDAPLGPRDDEDEDLFAGFGPVDGEHDLGLDRPRWGRRRRR